MLGALIVVSFLFLIELAYQAYMTWSYARIVESMRVSLAREQAGRAKDRLQAFRREQYLITLAYTAKPDLAAALANVPPPLEKEEPDEGLTYFDGYGHARTGN